MLGAEEELLRELHAWQGLRLRVRTGYLHVRYGLHLQEVSVLAALAVVGSCCTTVNGVCNCFPCTCIHCCCVYGAASLGVILTAIGIVRVVVKKEGVEVVGGDEKTRRNIAALLANAHYPVSAVSAEVWKIGTATVDATRQVATTAQGAVNALTTKEMKILRLFAGDPQAVVSREDILSSAWGFHYWGTTRTVDQHIANLRKKLGVDFVSVRGIGYRIA